VVDVGRRQQQGVVRQGVQGRIQAYRPRVEDRGTGRTLERPRNVREVDRSPSIDTRNIDIRLRDDGRNLKRAEEYRSERRVGGSERAAQLPPQWNLDRRRENRVPGRENIERRPADRPTREANRSLERQVPPRGTRRSERTPESRREWIDRPPVHREMMAPRVDRGGAGWRGLQGQERPMRQAQSSRMGGGAPSRAQGGGRRGR
jgi:hypothetical protein